MPINIKCTPYVCNLPSVRYNLIVPCKPYVQVQYNTPYVLHLIISRVSVGLSYASFLHTYLENSTSVDELRLVEKLRIICFLNVVLSPLAISPCFVAHYQLTGLILNGVLVHMLGRPVRRMHSIVESVPTYLHYEFSSDLDEWVKQADPLLYSVWCWGILSYAMQ